jgi:agmatine deiminase
LGFRLPAESEPHEATWVAWPHNRTDWPGRFGPIPWVYADIVRKLTSGEKARILVNSATHQSRARRLLERVGVDFTQVEFLRIATNRGWTRDYGPMFVRRPSGAGHRPGEVAIVRFRFNAWAKYPDWQLDDRVAERGARALGQRLFVARYKGRRIVLEGGAIDVNGRGSLIATEECLLDPAVQARNSGINRAEMVSIFQEFLGVKNVLWLGRGIAGDDTHGHVDDFCRFTGPRAAVLCQETNPRDINYRPLEENRERLEGMRLEDGSRLEVARLPMPEPIYFGGRRLPASYANFYIANAAVLVPTFNDAKDRLALGILAELFPDRPVVGIHSLDLVWGLGTLHCMTQQQPAV